MHVEGGHETTLTSNESGRRGTQEMCEDFALEIFTKADNEDRAGAADKWVSGACCGSWCCYDSSGGSVTNCVLTTFLWFERVKEHGTDVLRCRHVL